MVAFEAKEAGDRADAVMAAIGIDWVTFEGERIRYKGDGQSRHYEIIEAVTRVKVRQNPEVKTVLLATDDLILRPDHVTEEDAPPAWRYYEIYMKIRAELTKQGSRSVSGQNGESWSPRSSGTPIRLAFHCGSGEDVGRPSFRPLGVALTAAKSRMRVITLAAKPTA
jgi:hypothetical protein